MDRRSRASLYAAHRQSHSLRNNVGQAAYNPSRKQADASRISHAIQEGKRIEFARSSSLSIFKARSQILNCLEVVGVVVRDSVISI